MDTALQSDRDRLSAGLPRPATDAVVLSGLTKSYGGHRVVDDVSLAVPKGALLALLGPSGCGKTTILRSIAGFVAPEQGSIVLDGQDVTDVPPERRGTAMVFQNYALFPHMTVGDNVGFGLRMRGVARRQRRTRVEEALALVRLGEHAGRYPGALSGGQQQRAALARALVTEPRLLLLDEPFGALDQNLREDMQVELRKLQQRLGITAVVVTHDQQEAMILADQVAVMRAGRIEQLGSPSEIYDRPATRFVAGFIGSANIIEAVCEEDGLIRIGAGRLRLATHRGQVAVAVRPEAVELVPLPAQIVPGLWTGAIAFATNLGSRMHYEVDLDDGPRLTVEEPRRFGDAVRLVGARIGVRLDAARCSVLRD